MSKKLKYRLLFVLFVLMVLVWWAVFESCCPYLEVVFFDVGQGEAIFIQTPSRYQILIDGGPSKKILAKLSQVMPFYDRSLDLVVLTHPEADHLLGLIEVLKNYQVDLVLTNGLNREVAFFQVWQKLLKEKKIPVKIAQKGQVIYLGKEGKMEVLWPEKEVLPLVMKKKEFNNSSIVLKLVFQKIKFLFTGDIENKVEKILVEQNQNLKANVLKVAHHGSRTSTSQIFLEKVNPQIAVISVGRHNRYGLPYKKILERLEEIGVLIYRTDFLGDIYFLTDGQRIQVLTPNK